MQEELIQLLFSVSKNFEERFQSFLDQIPKPSGASSAAEKRHFFTNFFLGMFASVKSTELADKLNIKDLYFKLAESAELHIIVEKKNGEKQMFIFAESYNVQSESALRAEIDNHIGKSVKSKVTKILVGREFLSDGKWKHKILVSNQGTEVPSIDSNLQKLSSGKTIKLETHISKLSATELRNTKDIEAILNNCHSLYSSFKKKNLIQSSGNEAAQHAFASGILMNFRYRYHLRLYLELLTGRGYSDLVLLIKGKDLNEKAIPIVMEFKSNTKARPANSRVPDGITVAKKEAQSYAKGFSQNKMRISTSADLALCIGIDLNREKTKFYEISQPTSITKNNEPILQMLVNAAYSDKGIESKSKGLLSQVYYTFPSEQYTQRYLSRFLLGQVSLIVKPRLASNIRGYVFDHSLEEVKDKLTTFIFVTKEENGNDRVFIFHLQESGTIRFDEYSFTEDILNQIGVRVEQVTKVYVSGYDNTKTKESPGVYFIQDKHSVKVDKIEAKKYFKNSFANEGRLRSQTLKNKFRGNLINIENSRDISIVEFKNSIHSQKDLKESIIKRAQDSKIDRAIEVEHGSFSHVINRLSTDLRKIPKSSINSESEFKAYIDGELTGLSDLDGGTVSVLTEFQVGGGGRVDVMIQDRINPDAIGIGLELKYAEDKKTAEKLIEEKGQIEGYRKSKNIKSVTQGDKVVFTLLAFDASNPSILSTNKFVVADVTHSSLTGSVIDGTKRSGCSPREKRDIGMPCVDSNNKQKVIENNRQIRELLGSHVTEEIIFKELETEVLSRYDDIDYSSVNKKEVLLGAYKSFALSKKLESRTSEEIQIKAYYNALIDIGALLNEHYNHVSAGDLDNLNKRIESNPLLNRAKELYQIKGSLEPAKEIKELKILFTGGNIEGFEKELEAYTKEVVTIRPEQILNDGININVKVPNEELMIGSTKDLLNTENYTLDEETSEIKLKLGDEECTLVAEIKEKEGALHTRHYLTLSGGYTVKLSHLIANFGQNEIRQAIYDKLTTLELLDQKLHIEKIADITISDQNYENAKSEVKGALIEKGVSSEHAEKLISNIESSTSEVFTKYVNDIENDLVKNGVEVSSDKFGLAKANGVRGGKWFSLMAIYDLIDSTRDVSTIGRHDNNALKQVFGLNGILDSMNDVRQSLSTTYLQGSTIKMKFSPDSIIGKITSKVPPPVRKSFVKFIDNPAVRGLTFATIAYQFGYNAEEIAKGNHNPLNYYWLGSSGIKLGSMGMGYVSTGASFVMGGLSSSVMRAVSFTSKILGKLSIVTAVLDVVISICIDIYQSVVYTEKIAESIPLSSEEKAAIGFDHSFWGFLKPGEKDKEAENTIRAKEYLTAMKNVAMSIFCDEKIKATVSYVGAIEEKYNKVVSSVHLVTCGELPLGSCMVHKEDYYVCGRANDEYSSTSFLTYDSSNKKFYKPQLRPFTLNNTPVFVDINKKHIPHLNQNEYNNGIMIYSAPENFEFTEKDTTTQKCSYNSKGEIIGTHTKIFHFSGEPLIFNNRTRQMGSISYLSVPNKFIAFQNYSAIINVPKGQVDQTGTETVFIVNNYSSGKLKGEIGKQNTLVLNIDKNVENTVVDLRSRSVSYGPGELTLENVYNLAVNVTGNVSTSTDCKTRYISVNANENSYIVNDQNSNCANTDLEIREVNRNNVHFRGFKQTTFIVGKHSNNAKILNNIVSNKNNVDIIKIQTEDRIPSSSCSTMKSDDSSKVEDLKLEKNKNGYTLLLLKSTNPISKALSFLRMKENVIASIEIDSFTNLEIEKNGKRYIANIDTMELNPVLELPQEDIVYNIPPIKLYNPDEQGLQIYRDDEENIGFIDLRDKSILNCTMNIIDDRLILLHKGIPFVKIENWKINPSARLVIFAFKEVKVLNHECIVNYCSPETVIEKVREAQKLSPKIENFNEKHLQDFTRIISLKDRILQDSLSINNNVEDTNKMVSVAKNVKQYIEKYEENDLSPAIKNNLKDFKGRLTELVRGIAFSEELCIKNVRSNEYLYAATNYFNYDHNRRRVFTWITDTSKEGKNKKFKWKLEHYRGNLFHIKNVEYNEYLYCASNYFNYDNGKHSIFTWIKKSIEEGNQFEWEFTISNSSLWIKNIACEGYLYADVNYDKERRLLSIESKSSENSLWKVEHCSPELRLKRDIKETSTIEDTYISANRVSSMAHNFIALNNEPFPNQFSLTSYLDEYGRVVAHDLCSKLESNFDEYKGRNVSKCEENILNTAKSFSKPEEFMSFLLKDVNQRLEINYACEKKYSSEEENALQNVNHRKEYLNSCRKDTILDRQMINNNVYSALSKAQLWNKAFSMVDGNIVLANLLLTLLQKVKNEEVVENKFEELSEYHDLYSKVVNRTKIKTEMTKLIENNYNVTIDIAKEDLYDSNLVFSFLFGTEKEISDDLLNWSKELINLKGLEEQKEMKQLVDGKNFNELIKPIVKKIIRESENNKFAPKVKRISLEFKKACGKIVKEIPQASISRDNIYDSYRLDFISLVTQGISVKEITNDLFKRVDLLIRNRQSEEKGWFNKIKTVLLAILPTSEGIIEDNKRQENLALLKIRIESIVSEAINSSMSSEVNNHIYSNNLSSMTNSNLKPILSPPFTLIREPSLILNTLPSPVFNQISVELVVNNTTMIS